MSAVDDRLDHAPCGFLSFTDDGTVSWANRTALVMLGFVRAVLTGQHVERILTVGSRIFYQTHWFPLLRLHGRAEEIFLIFRAKDGADLGVLVNAARRERGDRAEYDCALMQVRERRKYEDELLRARRAAEQARAESEAQKRELERVNAQLEDQAVELELQQQQLQEQATRLEAAGAELQAANAGLMARTHEAEELRAAAEEANRAKSTFLAVMSHELRTPLNAIAGYVQILEMGIHGPVSDPQREALGRISSSGRHLLRLINQVLDLARIEAGHVEFRVADVPLAEVVDSVLPMLELRLREKRLGLTVEVPETLTARADRDKLQQILVNLLANAVKFTPPGGAITVAGRPRAGRVEISVADTGIGIPAEKLATVFEPFVQVDGSLTREEKGSGLGLAISRDLATGMGGDLRAESTPGEGSTFTLSLLRHSAEVAAPTPDS